MPGRVGLRTVPKFLNDVRSQLEIGKTPSYALLLGSGFSYPLIPTGSGMIRDIPWWLYSQSRPKPAENGHPARFGQRPASNDPKEAGFLTFESDLWATLTAEQEGLIRLKDGTPDLMAPNAVSDAYTCLMSSQDPSGLNTPQKRRAYLRDVIGRVGREINQAHLFLASILQTQDTTEEELASL